MNNTERDISYQSEYTIDIQDHPFLKYPPIQVNIILPPKGNSLGIQCFYCDYNNMTYIKTIKKHTSIWKSLPDNNQFNFWMISIDNDSPITVNQVISTFKSHQKYNKHTTISICVAKHDDVIKTTFQSIREAFHQMKPIGNKLVSSPSKPTPLNHIGHLNDNPLQSDWIDAIHHAYDKMIESQTFSCPFLRSTLPTSTKVLDPRLSFQVKLTEVDHIYDLKARLCADGSAMLEGVDFLLSYAPTADITAIRVLIALTSANKHMVLYTIDITNAYQNNVISDPAKRHYLSLPPFKHKVK
jgi:hypothetical protein